MSNELLERYRVEAAEVKNWLCSLDRIEIYDYDAGPGGLLINLSILRDECERAPQEWSQYSVRAGSFSWLFDAPVDFGLVQVLMFEVVSRTCHETPLSNKDLLDAMNELLLSVPLRGKEDWILPTAFH